jgi:hypothetical protein
MFQIIRKDIELLSRSIKHEINLFNKRNTILRLHFIFVNKKLYINTKSALLYLLRAFSLSVHKACLGHSCMPRISFSCVASC